MSRRSRLGPEPLQQRVRRWARRWLPWTVAGTALMACCASAHDTWFERHPSFTPTLPVMVLGTGNQYPVFDSRNDLGSLVDSGCQAGGHIQRGLVERDPQSAALTLSTPQPLPAAPRLNCWARFQPFEVELPDALVEAYFKEAMPPAAVRQAWAAQKARGQPWRERYVKQARLDWFSGAPEATAATAASSAGTLVPLEQGLDALLLQPLRAARVGDELEFQVYKDGKPLPNFSVEFRLQTSRMGWWRRTDDQGRVRLRPPAAGAWLLRGIELTPPPPGSTPPLWQGQFITLAFEVQASGTPGP